MDPAGSTSPPPCAPDDIWAKLLWAGLNLTPGDRPTGDTRSHPMELPRAITLTWPTFPPWPGPRPASSASAPPGHSCQSLTFTKARLATPPHESADS